MHPLVHEKARQTGASTGFSQPLSAGTVADWSGALACWD